jgi:hypothetical protein
MLLLRRVPFLATVLLLSLAACSAQPQGSVQFAASVPQALTSSDVTRVKVTVSAADMSAFSVDLAKTNGSWGGFISNIPAGSNRAFLAEAFDSSSALRFQGQTSGVAITANQTTVVAITLQELAPPLPYGNEAPIIDSAVASISTVQTGGSISLTATTHDPNTGDTLTLAWTASSGTFSAPTAATTSWTAPAATGAQTLTFTVTDSQGVAASFSLAVNVVSGAPTNSELNISFNLWPVVSKLSTSRSRLDAGQSTSVSATAADADGDALSYQWAASPTCPGTWTNATASSASFVPSSVPAGMCNNCRLTVTVQDGRGGQTTAALNLCIAAASTERFPPRFTNFHPSATSLSPGQTVTFDVTAMDPQASSLTFAWAANTGSLGAAQSTATTSHGVWTAPSCAMAGVTPTVTANVTNAYGLSASLPFSLSGLPECPTYPAGTITSGGLTWVRPAATTSTWLDGQAYCANTAIAGLSNWRLPTDGELGALYSDKGSSFISAQGWTLDWIWTMTPYSSGHTVRHMSNGGGSWANTVSTDKEFVTCVRGTGEFLATLSNAGLTWTRPDATARTYADAQTYCASTSIAGHTGGRLPTQSELVALHTAKGSNVLASAGWTLDWLWTTTPYSSGRIMVRDGGATSFAYLTDAFPMTCVYP